MTADDGIADTGTGIGDGGVGADDGGVVQLAEDDTRFERRIRALTMRNGGATFAAIAEAAGTTVGVAHSDVRAALRDVVRVPAEEMVSRQRAVLLDLVRANYPAALAGDREAQAMVLKTLEHEARLFGLYAPARISLGVSQTEFAEQAAKLLAVLGSGPLRELAGAQADDVVDADQAASLDGRAGVDGWANL